MGEGGSLTLGFWKQGVGLKPACPLCPEPPVPPVGTAVPSCPRPSWGQGRRTPQSAWAPCAGEVLGLRCQEHAEGGGSSHWGRSPMALGHTGAHSRLSSLGLQCPGAHGAPGPHGWRHGKRGALGRHAQHLMVRHSNHKQRGRSRWWGQDLWWEEQEGWPKKGG